MHADRIRDITGTVYSSDSSTEPVFIANVTDQHLQSSGAFTLLAQRSFRYGGDQSSGAGTSGMAFTASRVVPTGSYTAPRAFSVLMCVYLGA